MAGGFERGEGALGFRHCGRCFAASRTNLKTALCNDTHDEVADGGAFLGSLLLAHPYGSAYHGKAHPHG